MSRANLDGLLQAFGEVMQVDLSLGQDNYTVVQVDERIDLELSHDEGSHSFLLVASCGKLPQDNDKLLALLKEVTDANFHWSGAGGATLATNTLAGKLYVQFREQTDHLDAHRLQDLLNAIVHNANLWGDRLEKGSWAAATAATRADDASDPHHGSKPTSHVHAHMSEHIIRI